MLTLAVASDSIWSDMFAFQVPPLEKVLRTVLVYAAIALLIRVFGRRILAQLNLSDLVVVLLLSNVVQNSIIGEDSSVVGGLLGALVLVLVDYVYDRVTFMIKNSERFFDGRPVTLVEDGVVDTAKLRQVGIREGELRTVLHRLGADRPAEVEYAKLMPGGVFDMALKREEQNANAAELEAAVRRIEERIDERFAAMEARIMSGRE
ncbi:MAG: YetF domain-containing protein [Lapillicoccus sp.]